MLALFTSHMTAFLWGSKHCEMTAAHKEPVRCSICEVQRQKRLKTELHKMLDWIHKFKGEDQERAAANRCE